MKYAMLGRNRSLYIITTFPSSCLFVTGKLCVNNRCYTLLRIGPPVQVCDARMIHSSNTDGYKKMINNKELVYVQNRVFH